MNWQVDIPNKVIIIGGQAAGCKTAARLARLLPDCKITIIEKNSIISFGACGLPFYAAGEVDDVLDLAKTPWGAIRDVEFFKNAKGVDVLINTEVSAIDHQTKNVTCISGEKRFQLNYDALVLATGSKPIQPAFSCPNSSRIGNFLKPEDAKHFRQMAQTGKVGSVAILGGGYIGVELAEAMVSLWGLETTLIERENQLLPRMLDNSISKHLLSLLQKNDVTVKLESSVSKIETNDEENPVLFLDSGEKIEADYVFLCLGIKPESSLSETLGLEIGENGGILVDDQMQTSIPGIWAAGDCVEVKNLVSEKYDWFPLGSLANRQGRVVADSMVHRKTKFSGAVGTASVKVFDFIVASAGIKANKADQIGLKYSTVWGSFLDRPDYHPEKKNLFISMIYEPKTLRILGLQVAGAGEVTRYVDVVSALLPHNITAFDLLELEHAYTPPHSSPMSPLNNLGAMIIAQEKDDLQSISPDISQLGNDILLDVRTDDEVEDSPLNHESIKIPQEQIRNKIQDLDAAKPIHIICRRGPRSFEAARLLKNNGFKNVDYIGGGTAMLMSEEDDE
jgi:NADPH-dependent 2,4-dienoyl-CoA reductase/sulfur reductase-like enzyme/rhodanese-related sulfurtransferase